MLEIGINKRNHPDWERSDLGAKDAWLVDRIDDLLDDFNLTDAERIAEAEWEVLRERR